MNRREYNKTVTELSDGLFRYAVKLVKDSAHAQDLVQESFIKLWTNLAKVEVGTAKPFLYRVLYNKMVDDYRKNKRIQLSTELPDRGQSADDGSDRDLINRAFALLKENQKSIILLRDWEGHSYDEIATIMELSLSQVKVNLFRARKKMKSILISLQADQAQIRL